MPLGGFGNKKLVKLRYVEEFQLDTGLASTLTQIYRANSVFDPNFTWVGHQPMMFDGWATLYNRYVVFGSRASCVYTPSEVKDNTTAYYGFFLSSDPSFPSVSMQPSQILEQRNTGRYRIAGAYNSAQNIGPRAVFKKFSAKKYFGVSDVKDNEHLGALVTTNPLNPAYFIFWCSSVQGDNPPVLGFKITIDYIVQFSELQYQSQS